MTDPRIDRRNFIWSTLASGAALGAAAPGAHGAAQDAKGEGAPVPAERVPRKVLGDTGETIPILLQGGSQKFDKKYDKVLHRAFQEGIDYLDTALVYAEGHSHAGIATFQKQVERKKLWITSKVPHADDRATVEDFGKGLDLCLEQLETDYLDLFFMHGLNNLKYLEPEFIKMGDAMKKQKKIRFFGFSCHGGNVVELMNKAATTGGIDAIMFRYNFATLGDKKLNKAIDACVEAKIGLIAMKTQSSVPDDKDEVVRFQSKDFTLHQAKLKAVWEDERIAAAVSHMTSVQTLVENAAAAKSPVKLSMGDFHQLNRFAAHTAHHSCQGCQNLCEPRAGGGVRIADTLRYLMYHECYGQTDEARSLYRAMTPAARRFAGADLVAASAACPQGIDIPNRLEQAQRALA